MDNIVQSFDSNINNILNNFVKKQTVIRGAVHLLLMLYAAKLAPTPPKIVLDLFENVYFKLFVYALILWTAQFSPSTAILISLAFMVTINYTTTGKIWEMLENVDVPEFTATEAVNVTATEAVNVLATAAVSPEASDVSLVEPVAKAALASVTTQDGADAIMALAEQAVTPEAGSIDNVKLAVNTAMHSITVAPPASASAIITLADAAASPVATDPEVVADMANTAVVEMTDEQGVAAVQALAQQAVVAESGVPEKVAAAADMAAKSAGCYPLRNYDMSKVFPMKAGMDSFEDYQTWTPSKL